MNMNTTGSTRKSDIPKVIVHGKKRTRQPAKLLEALSPSKDDHNIITHFEDDKPVPITNSDILTLENCDNQRMDREDDDHAILTCEVDECISIEYTDDEINQQDQPDKPPDGSNDQHPCFEVKQERSNDIERHEEPDLTEVNEVPKEEERRRNEVVAHGKKETAAYDYVIEEVLKKQRLNSVKALVGTFEVLISCQCDVLKNNCQHITN